MKNEICKILLSLFLTFGLYASSQEISPDYTKIRNNSNLTIEEKDKAFKDLLKRHKHLRSIDFLLGDSYEILKWYRREGRLNKAITLNKENLRLMDSLNFDNTGFYRRNLYSLGFYQRKNDSLNNALETLNKILNHTKTDKYTIRSAFQIAEIYFTTGKYFLSKDFHNLSLAVSKDLNNPVYIVLNATGIALANKRINTTKSLNEGISTLKNAIDFAESLNNNTSDSKIIKDSDLYDMYSQLGNLYTDRVDYDFINGKTYLEKALNIATRSDNNYFLNRAYNDLGVLYLKDNNKRAEFYFNKALKQEPNTFMSSLINRNLSIHHLYFENYDQALNCIQTSLNIFAPFDTLDIKNLPSKNSLSKSNEKFQLISSLIDKANIWQKLGEVESNTKYYKEALKTLKLADYLIDITRLESPELNSKLFWRKTATEIYVNATKACFLSNNPEEAFYFIEKNKALLLLEDISLKMSRKNSNIPTDIIERELQLKTDIETLKKISTSKGTDPTKGQLLLAKDSYNKFIDSLDVKYRFYYKSKKPADVIKLTDFKKQFIKENNAYIEYILDDREGYGVLITKNEAKLFELRDCDSLKNLVIEYRRLLKTPFKDNQTIESYKTVANTLYNKLFPENIASLIKGKKLTIIPDYYLQNIPFESLLTHREDKSYLIYSNEISYAYSLTLLHQINNQQNTSHVYDLVGFAPIKFKSGLSQLKHTKEELKTIKKLFSSKMFLNEEANKKTFFKESGGSKIIHIASHANANDSISPWIAFYDNNIDLKKLYALNTTSELVVLSACNTSLGKLYKGEGVLSLSRGFFNTGSRSVLPTLWKINDKASVEVINHFYKNIKEGQNKSLALHNAKLKYLKNNTLSDASPHYWASFILIGDTSKIELNTNLPIYLWAIVIGLVLAASLLFLKKIKK